MNQEINKSIKKIKFNFNVLMFVVFLSYILAFGVGYYLLKFVDELHWWEQKVIEMRDELNLVKEELKNIKSEKM